MTAQTSATSNPPPLLYHRPALFRRVQYFIQLWVIKLISSIGFYILRRFISPAPAHLRPTIIKSYPSRPHLKHRFFIPRDESILTNGDNSYLRARATSAGNKKKHVKLYPLYISIHGGGFSLCDAEFDDAFCATFSSKNDILVANLSYSLTPSARFPTSLNDIIATIHTIIHDSTLPIDHTKICLAGFSAGGNLAIAASQHASLQGIIKAVVAWYPVTDMTLTPAAKQASRKYRNWFDRDDFPNWGPVWNWAYFTEGLSMRDPRIGVKWSKREDLPEWACVLGCEYDMLCQEASDMVEGWVGEIRRREVKSETGEGWEVNGGKTKWMRKWNVRHGFTHPITAGWAIGSHEVARRASEDAQREIVRWLWEGAWKEEDVRYATL
jgi:acetyl esterase/lipase